MDVALKFFRGDPDFLPEKPIVLLLEQDLLSVVAALNGMLGRAGQNEAR